MDTVIFLRNVKRADIAIFATGSYSLLFAFCISPLSGAHGLALERDIQGMCCFLDYVLFELEQQYAMVARRSLSLASNNCKQEQADFVR